MEVLNYAHSLGYKNILASNKAKDVLLKEVKELGKKANSIYIKVEPQEKEQKIHVDPNIGEYTDFEEIE